MSHHDLQSCISAATESVNVMRRNNRLFQQNRPKADIREHSLAYGANRRTV
jgi:hypothetical protein